jgi:hypothetical protein
MKRKVLIAATLFTSMLTYAQDQKSNGDQCTEFPCPDKVLNKKGYAILPKKGDIALGFNAVPMLDLVFNSLRYVSIMGNSAPVANNVAGNTVQFVQSSNNQIVGKYFLNDKTAIRAKIGINTLSGSMTNRVQDAEAMYNATLGTNEDINAASLIRVEDKAKFNKSNITIVAGYEKRRGYRRLQGFYGAEIGFGLTHARQTNTYGNEFSDVYDVQYTNNFNSFGISTQNPLNTRVERTLSIRERGTFRIGARGFIGIEYFVFPKISVGAEYGWGYSIQTRRNQKVTREVYQRGQNGPAVFEEEVNSDSNETVKGFSVDNNNGSIFSMNNTLGGNTGLGGGAGAITILFHF